MTSCLDMPFVTCSTRARVALGPLVIRSPAGEARQHDREQQQSTEEAATGHGCHCRWRVRAGPARAYGCICGAAAPPLPIRRPEAVTGELQTHETVKL